MSFAAEPYGVFVDDLISALTGGVTREDFVFLPERAPFRLGFGRDFVPGTVRAQGLSAAAYTRFHDGIDFTVDGDGVLSWLASGAVPAAGATWPDLASHFYVSYERVPDSQAPPRLTDRNPGSVLRTLAESFAREYAVLSRQLESVYRAGFLATAEGRDLDSVAALVGITRRTPTFASGEVVFARRSPAPADVFVPEGTRVSTSEVPPVTVVTTEARALRSGSLSVSVPVRAEVQGAPGIARAGTLTVVNRPILGVDSASNPFTLTLGGAAETDDALRRRASRALETSGRATVGSLVGALTSIEGIRAQDVRVTEDHNSFPGLVKVVVAADLSLEHAQLAATLLEEHRPAGIRVLHNLPVAATGITAVAPDGGPGPGDAQPPPGAAHGTWYDVGVTVAAVPSRPDLTTADRAALIDQLGRAVATFVHSLGIGETLVYNRLVSVVMAVEGVDDALIDVYPVPPPPPPAGGAAPPPAGTTPPPPAAAPPDPAAVHAGRANVAPIPADTRIRLGGQPEVTVWGALVAIDVEVDIKPLGIAVFADPASAAYDARLDIQRRLAEYLRSRPNTIASAGMLAALATSTTYAVQPDGLRFTSENVDDGLRISLPNQAIQPRADQAAWVRSVTIAPRTAPV